MDVSNALASVGSGSGIAPASSNPASDLSSDDFFKLLVTQLTNQDPLEPTSNEELLKQIASIRDIELSTSLTDSLQRLTGQQQFAGASGLIGQYITGTAGEDGTVQSGLVTGVRFADGGKAILQLSNGAELPVEQISSIQSPMTAAQALVGLQVLGLDRSNPSQPQLIDGVVTGVSTNNAGEPRLELDTGEAIDLRNVVSVVQTV